MEPTEFLAKLRMVRDSKMNPRMYVEVQDYGRELHLTFSRSLALDSGDSPLFFNGKAVFVMFSARVEEPRLCLMYQHGHNPWTFCKSGEWWWYSEILELAQHYGSYIYYGDEPL